MIQGVVNVNKRMNVVTKPKLNRKQVAASLNQLLLKETEALLAFLQIEIPKSPMQKMMTQVPKGGLPQPIQRQAETVWAYLEPSFKTKTKEVPKRHKKRQPTLLAELESNFKNCNESKACLVCKQLPDQDDLTFCPGLADWLKSNPALFEVLSPLLPFEGVWHVYCSRPHCASSLEGCCLVCHILKLDILIYLGGEEKMKHDLATARQCYRSIRQTQDDLWGLISKDKLPMETSLFKFFHVAKSLKIPFQVKDVE